MSREVLIELQDSGGRWGNIHLPVTPKQLYESLPVPAGSRCIRLLELDAETPGWTDKTTSPPSLSGRLCVATLNPPPSFAALSYVWGGDEAIRRTITCQDCDLEITENCHQALWHIQKRFGAVTVWVDSICINQTDDDEKTGQIALMGEVYSLAGSVYVWLGLAADDSDNAMDFLKWRGRQGRRLPLGLVAARPGEERRRQSWLFLRRAFGDIKCKLPAGIECSSRANSPCQTDG